MLLPISRSLASNPRLLMLDESLGAPGCTLRDRLLVELRPATPFAARFLGMSNILSGSIISLDPPVIETRPAFEIPGLDCAARAGQPVRAVIGPEAGVIVDV